MTEASVSTPFMSKLRELRPKAEVIKHRDASMIGLPDCSVTDRGHALWMEFKLYAVDRKFEEALETGGLALAVALLSKARKEAPTQYEKMVRLHQASWSIYVIWLKKTCVALVDPVTLDVARFQGTSQAVEFVASKLAAWPCAPFQTL